MTAPPLFALGAQHLALQADARAFARAHVAPRAAEVDRTEAYPWDTVAKLKDAGYFGMTLPKAYGGQGRTYLETVLVIEEMAKACGITGRIVVEANMGAIGAIMAYGSEQQKRLAAGMVLDGDKPAICITEPGAGSAATQMTTRADKRGNGYVLNGTKHWITGGGVSRLHLIFARLFDDGVEQGIAGFIAIRDPNSGEGDKGLVIGAREPAMGLRGIPETRVDFRDLTLGGDRLIVPPEGVSRGFAGLMEAYNGQRVGAATVALGLAGGAHELALAYAKSREQFGRPIAEFQGLQWMLADADTELQAARLMVYAAAASAGRASFPDARQAAQAKVFASEMAIRVTNTALQVHGAAGYSRNNPLERMVRDARMFTIGGGTAQVLRTLIAAQVLGMKLPQTRDGYVPRDRPGHSRTD